MGADPIISFQSHMIIMDIDIIIIIIEDIKKKIRTRLTSSNNKICKL